MEIRQLKAKDAFPLLRIFGKLNIKELLSEFFGNSEKDKQALGESIVITIVDVLVTNLPLVEDELFDFVGDVTGEGREAVEELPLVEFVKLLTDFVKQEDFKHFFESFNS